MDITVCICTYNRPDYIRGCLDGLRQQTVPSNQFEILVVDSASTGDVPAQLERMVVEIDNARLLRIEQPGISIARNAGARQASGAYVAYIDDDAIPAADWVERIMAAIGAGNPPPSLIGGRILPRWEAPLPAWWPAQLRGVLSIIECEGEGEYRTGQLPAGLEPYGANMAVHVQSLFAVGGFGASIGRLGKVLLSDEEVQVAWRMQAAGRSVRYNSRIVVQHRIQATRLTPGWLLSRLYWQGVSTVLTRRLLGRPGAVWRELPRRALVAAVLAPSALLPVRSTRLVQCRWRLAYACGFIWAALGWGGVAASARAGS